MTTTLEHPTTGVSRRCFRWDLNIDLTRRAQADARAWLRTPPARANAAPLPDPEVWAANMSRAVVEVIVGVRPVTQLQRWLVPPLYAALVHLHQPRAQSASQRPCRPVSWRSCSPRDGVVEVATVVAAPDRTRIVAVRLENHRGRWITTALEFA
ncbi:Rv3235 family protein [Schaalia vaccimaxillae]|uniref:Rv3235 family protein n=1 Tax=Schaalia vaccimaxillae TaxID=183916 RepID=UPI0003B79054|nr:Rv3235 family protein [Schaalia vaccimaxillae]